MKQDLQRIISRNLIRLRTSKNYTQEELAEKAGISTTFYANLESGKKMMSVVTLRKLADALCISTDSLLYDDRPDERFTGLRKQLETQPDQVVSFVEKFVQLYVAESPAPDLSNEKVEDPVL